MFRWSASILNPEPASDIIQLEELGIMSLNNSVWQAEQASIIYKFQLSTLLLNENRAAMINYYHISISSRLRSLLYTSSSHGKWKKQFQYNRVLNLQPCRLDLNLMIDWHNNNLSHNALVLHIAKILSSIQAL